MESRTGEREPTNVSKEVLISITNECRAKIKVYDTADRTRLVDIYNCSYKSILPIYLEEGNYKVEAENFQGKRVKKNFTKKRYVMTLDIEF